MLLALFTLWLLSVLYFYKLLLKLNNFIFQVKIFLIVLLCSLFILQNYFQHILQLFFSNKYLLTTFFIHYYKFPLILFDLSADSFFFKLPLFLKLLQTLS